MNRKSISVWIEGVSPLLLHRFAEAAEGALGKPTRRTLVAQIDPRVEAGRCVYRDAEQALCIPGAAPVRLLREAGSSHKMRGSRKSVKFVVSAAVLCMDDLVPLYLPDRKTRAIDFEVDSRPVTIPSTKGRIMRHRARLNAWAARFTLSLNSAVLDEATVRQLLVEGGEQIGLGDFRPEKGGPFGCFQVVSWGDAEQVRASAAAE